jgi:hypothetical protein
MPAKLSGLQLSLLVPVSLAALSHHLQSLDFAFPAIFSSGPRQTVPIRADSGTVLLVQAANTARAVEPGAMMLRRVNAPRVTLGTVHHVLSLHQAHAQKDKQRNLLILVTL